MSRVHTRIVRAINGRAESPMRDHLARRFIAGTAIALWIGLSILPGAVLADSPTATPLQEPTNSTIPVTFNVTGKVASGTAGVIVPQGIPITLHAAHPAPKNGSPQDYLYLDTVTATHNTSAHDT